MNSALAAEILKTRKRWMPYVLLLVCVVGVLFLTFPAGYMAWRDDPFYADSFNTFVFPYSIAALLDSGQFWGSMFAGILAASVVATEYNWGTVRQALIRGQTRNQYLVVKLAGIALIAGAILLTALAFGFVVSIYATLLADEPVTLDVRGGPTVPEIGLMVLRAGFCIVPYGMLAFMLAVVTRSGTLGITGIIFFLVGEAISIAILDSLGGFGSQLTDISLAHNVTSVLSENVIDGRFYNSMALRDRPGIGDHNDANAAALILLAHAALYAFVAFRSFGSRDIKTA